METNINPNALLTTEVRNRVLSRGWSTLFALLTACGILLIIHEMFTLGTYTGITLLENSYLYLLLAVFLSLVFILFPGTKGAAQHSIPWYDVALFLVTIGVTLNLAWYGREIFIRVYMLDAPVQFTVSALVLWLLVLEGARRTGGVPLLVILLLSSLYPLLAGYLPDVVAGITLSLGETARFHALSTQSIIGTPMQVVSTMLIGFIIMGMALVVTGGGSFFFNLAASLMGTSRGGPAKVAVISSALFGTMSGSVTANVLTTGCLTIPAMKRIGYPPTHAAAIEACASTGGTLMPPVMGATAFVMASFLSIPYVNVAAAAAIPGILFYLSLFLQVDGFAARVGLKGLAREELPSLWRTLREGWFYIVAGIVLIWLLVYLGQQVLAPFYATAVLLLLANVEKRTRLSFPKLVGMVVSTGRAMVELVPILAGVGLIVGSMTVTGLAPMLATELMLVAGGNILFLLAMGAVVSFILGMGVTAIAVYVILAVVLAPALVSLGLNPMAVHLFILYWGMISFITPPVAIGAYVAASIAQAPPIQTGLVATRMGIVLYLLPFFFVLNPVLVLQGVTWGSLAAGLATALAGVFLIAGGASGYLVGIGRLGLLTRFLVIIGGILIAWSEVWAKWAGLAFAAAPVAAHVISRINTATKSRRSQ